MKDPYQILGVTRDSSQNEIKKAYRKLAKELHPDRNPDNRQLADRFKEVSAAYQILGDAKDRARYDRGEIDASGNERHPGFRPGGGQGAGRAGAGPGPGPGTGPEGFDFSSQGGFEDLFGELFGNFRRSSRQGPRIRGADRRYGITIGFLDAIHGGKRRVALSGGKTLEVNIPAGIEIGRASCRERV